MARFSSEYRVALIDWVNTEGKDLDLAVSWALPNAYKFPKYGPEEEILRCTLKHYFNVVDQQLFKSAYRKHRLRLRRFLVLEHSQTSSVGWHAHGLVSSQCLGGKGTDVGTVLEKKWKSIVDRGGSKYSSHIFWMEPAQNGYIEYITKGIDVGAIPSIFDAENTVLNY